MNADLSILRLEESEALGKLLVVAHSRLTASASAYDAVRDGR